MSPSDLSPGIALPAAVPVLGQAAVEVVDTVRRPEKWVKGKPQLKDHFVKNQQHVKYGPITHKILNLLDADDLGALNELYEQSHNPTGDGACIEIMRHSEPVVVGDKWICHIMLRDIFYRKLDPHDSDDTNSKP
jgi:hypothetical protein